jgi:hypothetical protein
VETAAPKHADRVLVEQTVRWQLAAQRATVTDIMTIGDALVIRVGTGEDLIQALHILVAHADDLRSTGWVQVVPEGLPPLTLDPDVLRRVATLVPAGGGLSPLAALPAMLAGLLALGRDARSALDVCVVKAVAAADLDPPEGDLSRPIMQRLKKGAKRARRVVLQLRTLSGVTTPGSTKTLLALAQLERATADGVRAQVMAALARLGEVVNDLPDEALPWFEPDSKLARAGAANGWTANNDRSESQNADS